MSSQADQSLTLDQLNIGQLAEVIKYLVDNDLSQRIEEMGLTPGAEVEIIRFAPLGDPIEIKVRGYLLSLRKEEAAHIQVKLVSS